MSERTTPIWLLQAKKIYLDIFCASFMFFSGILVLSVLFYFYIYFLHLIFCNCICILNPIFCISISSFLCFQDSIVWAHIPVPDSGKKNLNFNVVCGIFVFVFVFVYIFVFVFWRQWCEPTFQYLIRGRNSGFSLCILYLYLYLCLCTYLYLYLYFEDSGVSPQSGSWFW